MPKAKPKPPPSDQIKRFRAEVQRMIDAGELSPTDADAAFDRVVLAAKGDSKSAE
jgi:hypothetical protein